jgi:hypothetical protein
MRPDFGGLRVRCVSLRAVYREKGNQVHLYIELFKAKDAWLQLSSAARTCSRSVPRCRECSTPEPSLSVAGLLSLQRAITPAMTSSRSGSCPTPTSCGRSRMASSGTNWYDYFEQVNASGELADFESVARRVMEL